MDDAQGGMPQDGGGMGGGMMGGAPSGGDLGGGAPTDFGEDLDSLGAPNADDQGDISGQEGSMPTSDMGTEEGQPTANESIRKNKPLLTEGKNILQDTYLRSTPPSVIVILGWMAW